MTNYEHGHHAEKVAAHHLEGLGYAILTLNWRHPRGEIDIIAQKQRRGRAAGPVVLFEVKYRRHLTQGQGLDYITARKLEQMRFAAELWALQAHYEGEYILGAIEVAGEDYRVTQLLENLM